ncbi:MAG: type I-E CRISPR-associated protein Cse2/CasB [Elusimicrobiota bacterium]
MNGQDFGQDFTVLFEWWKNLENDRGSRAELRRAQSPEEVVFCTAYHALFNRLHWNERDRDKLAAIAGLAAHVKNDTGEEVLLAEQMATPKTGVNPVISNSRFRRLLAIQSRNELFIPLMRIIKMLDGNANLRDLAKSVFCWNKKIKKEWAYSYWKKAPIEK